jgi:hypothetical protein
VSSRTSRHEVKGCQCRRVSLRRGCTLRVKCVVGRRRYNPYVLPTETRLIRLPPQNWQAWRLENLLQACASTTAVPAEDAPSICWTLLLASIARWSFVLSHMGSGNNLPELDLPQLGSNNYCAVPSFNFTSFQRIIFRLRFSATWYHLLLYRSLNILRQFQTLAGVDVTASAASALCHLRLKRRIAPSARLRLRPHVLTAS